MFGLEGLVYLIVLVALLANNPFIYGTCSDYCLVSWNVLFLCSCGAFAHAQRKFCSSIFSLDCKCKGACGHHL